MATKQNLNKFVATRVTDKVHKKFHVKSKRYGKPSDVLREMIEAFVEGRLVIQPNPTKESLYEH